MKAVSRIIIGIIIVDIFAVLLTLLAPVPSQWVGDTSLFHLSLADSAIYSIFYFGGALLFLVGLRDFKASMRAAYSLVAIGIMLTAVTFAQVPIISALGLWNNPFIAGGAPGILYILAGLFLYAGVAKFARLVGVTSITTSFFFVIFVALAGSLLAPLLPHAPTPTNELILDLFNAIIAWIGIFSTMSAVVAWQVRHHIGAHYVNAMAWLFVALASSAMVIVLTLAYGLLHLSDAFTYGLLNPFIILSSLLYLKAGQAFTKARDY